MNEQLSGIINILKPSGMTSHDVVYKIRKKFNIQKVGHTGTLDQNVAGVLPIVIGKATKLSQILTDKDKTYRCIMTFGKKTDTSDTYGQLIENIEKTIDYDDLKSVCETFIGEMEQTPSMYSAIKVNGQKLYSIARKGKTIDNIPKRTIVINEFSIIKYQNNTLIFDVDCSKGTYIRSLVEDIAQKLDTVAYMNLLIRTKSGQFDICDSVPIEDVGQKDIIPIDKIHIKGVKKIVLNDNQVKRYKNGLTITKEYIRDFVKSEKNLYKIYDKDENLISIGNFVDEKLKNVIMI